MNQENKESQVDIKTIPDEVILAAAQEVISNESKQTESDSTIIKSEIKVETPVAETPAETMVKSEPTIENKQEQIPAVTNPTEVKIEYISSSKDDTVTMELIKSLADRVIILENKISETDTIQKSVSNKEDELKKSFIKEIDELKKANIDLANSYEELKKSLSKPVSKRVTATNLDIIQKGSSVDSSRKYENKDEVLERLEELRKAGKVSDDDVIKYNAANVLTEKAKKALK
jgi:hypothetical protein